MQHGDFCLQAALANLEQSPDFGTQAAAVKQAANGTYLLRKASFCAHPADLLQYFGLALAR